MTLPTEKLNATSAPLTLAPFQFIDIRGWGMVVTKFEASDDNMEPFFTTHALLWLNNENNVTPIVLATQVIKPTAEDALLETFMSGELIFGSKVTPTADVINDKGEKIGELDVVSLVQEQEKQFAEMMQTITGDAPATLH